MIGLRNLPDGGHVLEHPAGPLYVHVKRRLVVHAEIALWGSPYLVSWPRPARQYPEARLPGELTTTAKGGGAAGQA